jgi:ABC-type antimicrobial peptide transport system permease subunit
MAITEGLFVGEVYEERRYPLLHSLHELLIDLISDRVALLGTFGLVILLSVTLAAPLVAPYDRASGSGFPLRHGSRAAAPAISWVPINWVATS